MVDLAVGVKSMGGGNCAWLSVGLIFDGAGCGGTNVGGGAYRLDEGSKGAE